MSSTGRGMAVAGQASVRVAVTAGEAVLQTGWRVVTPSESRGAVTPP